MCYEYMIQLNDWRAGFFLFWTAFLNFRLSVHQLDCEVKRGKRLGKVVLIERSLFTKH